MVKNYNTSNFTIEMDETQTIGDTNLFQVPKFIDKKYGLEVCTIDLFGRDPERSMECNFLLFFPQSQLCCRAVPCHQSDIILFPRIRSSSGDQFQSIVAGASTSER
jgi:hypothetical protein